MKKRILYGKNDIDSLPQLQRLSPEERFEMRVVASVLPFRTNNYIIENLIDWENWRDDPVFRMNFMARGMLDEAHFEWIADALRRGVSAEELDRRVQDVRLSMNPHPAGQLSANVPLLDGERVPGVQHKYAETCLVFPSNGQTCLAYCTFCFRWPQFTNMSKLKFATDEAARFRAYIARHPEITDVLITGGDPMSMSARLLSAYIEPFLGPGFEHIQTIRIGSKTLGHWPFRFLTDPDADDILRLFEKVGAQGKHLAFMAHFNHGAELSTQAVRDAAGRIRSTGAEIRSQAPLLRGVNDDADVWSEMWRTQVRLGIVPYYMFVERDTGPSRYFEVPLYRAHEIYSAALRRTSGLARTARGPSMSATPGKVVIDGTAEIGGEKVFVLSFIQARNPKWVKRPFFARYDKKAVWLTDLVPAFGEPHFFFEKKPRPERIGGTLLLRGLHRLAG